MIFKKVFNFDEKIKSFDERTKIVDERIKIIDERMKVLTNTSILKIVCPFPQKTYIFHPQVKNNHYFCGLNIT